jgi:hypothetical protein
VGELPNSHGRTLTDKSYVLHGIPYYSSVKDVLKVDDYGLEARRREIIKNKGGVVSVPGL